MKLLNMEYTGIKEQAVRCSKISPFSSAWKHISGDGRNLISFYVRGHHSLTIESRLCSIELCQQVQNCSMENAAHTARKEMMAH